MAFLIVLGGGAFILGLAYIVWIVVTKRHSQGTPNWPKVTGTVVRSRVYTFEHETSQGQERTYTPLVTYSYGVRGEVYTSAARDVWPYYRATTLNLQGAVSVISKYPDGSRVSVYYNPANPKQSLLEVPKPAAHNAVLYYGLANVIMGAAIVALSIVLL